MVTAAWSPPDFMVVESLLEFHLSGDVVGPKWVRVECTSKAAYGCGELGDKLLQGLELYVHRISFTDLNSSLSIALSDEAIRSIQAQLGLPLHKQGAKGNLLDARGHILIADRGVLVLHVIFRIWGYGVTVYYLVYDAMDQSLYMIPSIPSHVEATYTVAPVPSRPAGCVGHELAVAAQSFWPQPGNAIRGRLCLSTPATRADASSDGAGPWAIKVHGFPEFPRGFSVDVMFSVADKVFWGDLSRGVAYSDLRQGGGAVVDVVYAQLPDGYQIDVSSLPMEERMIIDPPKMSRPWAAFRDPSSLSASIEACLVILQPRYPVLMADGVLGLLLPKTRHRRIMSPRIKPDYICSFDIFTKWCLSLRQVRGYHFIRPLVLPYGFFKNCYPAPKRKPPTRKRKQPTINT